MKIGVITLSASDNCGSLLQCYALKKVLEKYGEVEIINFFSESSHAMYDIYPRGISFRNRIHRFRNRKKLKMGKQGYKVFRKEYLRIHGKEYFAKDLNKIADKYDIIVTGSDQVWNVQMEDFDEAFFLNWTQAKKVAYAPSLGGRNFKLSSNYENIIKWVRRFDFLSVREDIGKECLEEVTGKQVVKVLDPTLLFDEKEWNNLVEEPLVEGDYIFFYSWAYCEDSTSKIVANESKRLGIPTYVIDPRKWIDRSVEKWGFKLYKKNGPHIFLNLMKYAKKCYVESFHGMVFAYIFKKDFWLLDTHQNFGDLDSRLMEFVKLLGAEDRILTEYNVKVISQDKQKNYDSNSLLNEMKRQSSEFLESALGGE